MADYTLDTHQYFMKASPVLKAAIALCGGKENGFRSPIARISSESYLAAFEIIQSLGLVCTFPGRFLREQGNRYPDLVVIPVRKTISPLEISLLTRADVPPTPAAREMAACIRRRVNTVYRPVRGQTKSNPKR